MASNIDRTAATLSSPSGRWSGSIVTAGVTRRAYRPAPVAPATPTVPTGAGSVAWSDGQRCAVPDRRDPGAGRADVPRRHRHPRLRLPARRPVRSSGRSWSRGWSSPSSRSCSTSSATRWCSATTASGPASRSRASAGSRAVRVSCRPASTSWSAWPGPLAALILIGLPAAWIWHGGHGHVGHGQRDPLPGAVDQHRVVGAEPAADPARSTAATSPCRCSTWPPRAEGAGRPRSCRSSSPDRWRSSRWCPARPTSSSPCSWASSPS